MLANVESTFVRTLETFGPISDAIALIAESWNFPPNVSPSFAIFIIVNQIDFQLLTAH